MMIMPFTLRMKCDDCGCEFDYVDSFFHNGHRLVYPQFIITKCPNCGKEIEWTRYTS